jgi:hypothetical protein
MDMKQISQELVYNANSKLWQDMSGFEVVDFLPIIAAYQ